MKKKLLFGSALLVAGMFNAQTYFTEDFSGAFWSTIDSDGDSFEWQANDYGDGQGNVATSASWDGTAGPLTPDNWMISPSIAIPAAAGAVELRWKVYAQDQAWVSEQYTVYVATANTVGDFTSSSTSFNETLTTSTGYMSRSLDVSSFAGQTIYIGVRHWNSNDWFRINMDDFAVLTPFDDDATLTSATIDGSSEGARSVDVVVTNNGTNNITAFDMEWTFDGGAATTENVTGINLAPGQTNTINVSLGNLTIGNYAFTADVTTVNGGTDGAPGDNSTTESFTIVENIPNWTLTDTYGTSFTLHDVLSQGQAVILDFFASWCGPCESSTPELNTLYEAYGSGNEELQVFGLTVEATDTDAIVNGLGWGATYPKFSYSSLGESQYGHYASALGLNTDGYIPFFVMICPDINNPGASEIVQSDAGFGTGMFPSAYEPKIGACATATYNGSTSIEEVNSPFSLSVFPNPISNLATIQFNLDNATETSIEVTNMIGQAVYTSVMGELFGQQNITVDFSTYDSGIYMLNVITNGTKTSKRIVVTK